MQLENGQKHEGIFHLKRWQKVHEKMFNITSYKKNQNYDHIEILPLTY